MWKKLSRPSIRKIPCRRWYSELGPFLILFRIFAHETQTLQRAGCQGAHIDSFPSRAQGLAFFPSIRGQELKFYPYWMCITVPPGYGKACSQSTTYNGLKNEQSFILYEWFASVKFLDSPASIIHRNELNNVSFAVGATKLLDTNLSMAFG